MGSTQDAIMGALGDEWTATPQIAEAIGYKAYHISRALRGLARHGLVEMRVEPTRRGPGRPRHEWRRADGHQ